MTSVSLSDASTASAMPAVTADLILRTGLDVAILSRLVRRFYDRMPLDQVLCVVFADHITDWGPHLTSMIDFWSSVALMTGRCHGAPMPKEVPLPVEAKHFERWLALFSLTAAEVCRLVEAARVIERTERMVASVSMNIYHARVGHGHAGVPPQF